MSKKTLTELEKENEELLQENQVLKEQHSEKDEILADVKEQKDTAVKKLKLLENSVISKKITTEVDGQLFEIMSDCSILTEKYTKEDLAKEENQHILKKLLKLQSGVVRIIED